MLSKHKPFLFIVSAPSGCGKSTLLRGLFSEVSGLSMSVSYTTRAPRAGELDGIDYHFIKPAMFLTMQEDNRFVEYATVHANFYGTSIDSINSILDDGLDVVLDIDVQGMAKVKSSGLFDVVTLFILPPDIDELESRLRKRKTDSDDVISVRLNNALSEMEQSHHYDYIIINRDLNTACDQLAAIVISERLRSSRHIAT